MSAPKRKPATTKVDTAVGSAFVAPVQGGFAACQIVRERKGMLLIAALDWYGEAEPTLAELTPAKPLLVTHHFWRSNPHALWVSARVPRDWRYLGSLPPASVGTVDSHGYAEAVPYQAPLQWHWDHRIPAEARKRYERTKALAGEQTLISGIGKPIRLSIDASKISIGPEKELDVPLGRSVDWRALEPLGCLSEVDYTGTDAGVLALLERAPIIRSFSWQRHGQERIDVRSLDLDQLILDQDGALTLLADRVSTLTVLGSGAGLTVKMPAAAGLHLRLSGTTTPSLPIKGLQALSRKLELQTFQRDRLRADRCSRQSRRPRNFRQPTHALPRGREPGEARQAEEARDSGGLWARRGRAEGGDAARRARARRHPRIHQGARACAARTLRRGRSFRALGRQRP